MIGKKLAHYEILDRLGKGGMGEVFLAQDSRLDRRVALKVLPQEMARDADRRARFEREARAVAALNHPNIVTVHSVEESGGVHFITMELVEGEPLSRRIPKNGLPLAELLEIATPLADALAAAHEKGITHRDLKPDNVMITTGGRLKVLDFGLAKQAIGPTGPEEETRALGDTLTKEGRIVGTVHYMSPEQAEGLAVDPRSDVFSLGIILYELATGKRPFHGDSALSTLSSILKDTPAPLHEVKPGSPRELEDILQRCLAKDPGERFQSAVGLRRELHAMRSTATPAAQTTGRSWYLPLLVVVVAALAAMWFLGGEEDGDEAAWRSAPASVASQDTRASVAVLPFANMSADPENEYFSDGLAETLMHKLAQLRNLHVAARTSSFAFKGRNEDVRKIAAELGVSSILEGSVQKSGKRLRITVQLVDASTGGHLFSRTFDRTNDDVFAIQDEIAREVVDALEVELLGDENDRLATRETESLEAFDAYLLGLQYLASQGWSNYEKALDYFEQAVEADAGYAAAWVRIADVYVQMMGTGMMNEQELAQKAIPVIDRALAIDPELAEAYALRGVVRAGQGRVEEAQAEFAHAMELDPESNVGRQSHAVFLIAAARYDEALDLLRPVSRADPLNMFVTSLAAVAHEGAGNFGEARRLLGRIRELDPRTPRGYYAVAFLEHAATGEIARAIPWMLQAMERETEDYELPAYMAQIYMDLGDAASARPYLDRALEKGPEGGVPRLMEMRYLEHVGRADDARRLAISLLDDPGFSPRRSRAEFLRTATRDMDPSTAALLYEKVYPVLRTRTPYTEHAWSWTRPVIQFVKAKTDYARLMFALGENEAAGTLLEDVEAYVRAVPRMGRLGYGVLDAEIAAVRGRPDDAMAMLREAVDAGWTWGWWWDLRYNRNLASLHDREDYRQLVEEMEAKIARQRATLD